MDDEVEEQTLMSYIDMLAPDHDRTGCEDPHSYNSAFRHKGTVYNKCQRCTLLRIAELARKHILWE
jgi:hypothetical protein